MKNELKELMAAYDIRRAAWIKANGSDEGFDAWFTEVFKKSIGVK